MDTRVLKIDKDSPQQDSMVIAADIIRKGGIVAFPTETVYGLAANYNDQRALEKIYQVKDRPKSKPLTIQIEDKNRIKQFVGDLSPAVRRIVDTFWPGPLTIIFSLDNDKKIGIRVPDNKVAISLIKRAGAPIVAPSANTSGNRPPRTAQEVLRDMDGKIDLVLDAGSTDIGLESTVLDVSALPFKILREGAITKKEITALATKDIKIEIS